METFFYIFCKNSSQELSYCSMFSQFKLLKRLITITPTGSLLSTFRYPSPATLQQQPTQNPLCLTL